MINLVGERRGKLLAAEMVDAGRFASGSKKIKVRCICECGNEKHVDYGSFLSNTCAQSCGCVRFTRAKKLNDYKMLDDICIGVTSSGAEFVIDKEDLELVKGYTWTDSDGYIVTTNTTEDGTTEYIYIHRLILGLASCKEVNDVDHIDGNPLNNRKSNLRLCEHIDNSRNRNFLSKNNSSGFTGVSKRGDKFRAYINVEGAQIHLGLFNTAEDAYNARLEAEEKYFGEFAPRREVV